MRLILESLYFMLPAYAANMAPVFAAHLCKTRWSRPISERLLGSHKTYRGFVAGIVIAILVVYIQRYWATFALISYNQINALLLGIAFGFGALGGDVIKSYFKRRKGLSPGTRWIPWDQIDFVIGALIVVAPFYTPSIQHLFVIIILSPALHIAANHIGYILGLRTTRW